MCVFLIICACEKISTNEVELIATAFTNERKIIHLLQKILKIDLHTFMRARVTSFEATKKKQKIMQFYELTLEIHLKTNIRRRVTKIMKFQELARKCSGEVSSRNF